MRTPDLTRYTCDRCQTSAIIAKGEAAKDWHDIRRIDSTDTDSYRLVCEACYRLWKPLAQKHDIEFQTLMSSHNTDTGE